MILRMAGTTKCCCLRASNCPSYLSLPERRHDDVQINNNHEPTRKKTQPFLLKRKSPTYIEPPPVAENPRRCCWYAGGNMGSTPPNSPRFYRPPPSLQHELLDSLPGANGGIELRLAFAVLQGSPDPLRSPSLDPKNKFHVPRHPQV